MLPEGCFAKEEEPTGLVKGEMRRRLLRCRGLREQVELCLKSSKLLMHGTKVGRICSSSSGSTRVCKAGLRIGRTGNRRGVAVSCNHAMSERHAKLKA